MNPKIQWEPLFKDYGNGMVYRSFEVCGRKYAVGFEQIMSIHDMSSKGINFPAVHSTFTFPENGVWAVVFDSLDPDTEQPMGYKHVEHAGLASGRVLCYVASTIFDHYSICNAGAYFFTAAVDIEKVRTTDLSVTYSRALGLQGYRKSKFFSRLTGWKAYTDAQTGGRGYVITTESYP